MTSMIILYNGQTYTLTTEASQSSYGEPVLVAPDGVQMRGGEVAGMLDAIPGDEEGFFASVPARPLLAREVVIDGSGTYVAAPGEMIRDADGNLTDYGHACGEMVRRFVNQ